MVLLGVRLEQASDAARSGLQQKERQNAQKRQPKKQPQPKKASASAPPQQHPPSAAKRYQSPAAGSQVAVQPSSKVPSGSSSAPGECDNTGRQYDLSTVIVNFANVGTTFGKKILRDGIKFHWEGVRRCVKHLVEELRLTVIGVVFENWVGADDLDQPTEVKGVPQDIRDMCEHVEETPRITGTHHRSADDEMTIKVAYRRNCRMLDNDNYKDWLRCLRNDQIRAWLEFSQERVHMKYFFHSGLGDFETLDGNAERGQNGDDKAAFGANGHSHRYSSRGPKRMSVSSRGGKGSWRSPSNAAWGTSARPTAGSQGYAASASSTGPPVSEMVPRTPPGNPPVTPPMAEPGYGVVAQAQPYGPAYVDPIATMQVAAAVIPMEGGFRAPMGPTISALPDKAYPQMLNGSPQVAETYHMDWSSHGSSLHSAVPEGWTELCVACYDDNHTQVLYLLDRGADPNLPNFHKLTPLYYAVFNWNISIVEALKRHGADVSLARGPNGEPIAEFAVNRYAQRGGDIHAVAYHEMFVALGAQGPPPARPMVQSASSQLHMQHSVQHQAVPSSPKRRRTDLVNAGGSGSARQSSRSSNKVMSRTVSSECEVIAASPPSSTAVQQQREREPPAVRRRRIAALNCRVAAVAASEVPTTAAFSEGTPPAEASAVRKSTATASILVEEIDLTEIDASPLMDGREDEMEATTTEGAQASVPVPIAVEDPYLGIL